MLASLVLALSSLPLIPLIFPPPGERFATALEEARAQGAVTAELSAAFHDRVAFAAHVHEMAVVLVIVVLMVAKPF